MPIAWCRPHCKSPLPINFCRIFFMLCDVTTVVSLMNELRPAKLARILSLVTVKSHQVSLHCSFVKKFLITKRALFFWLTNMPPSMLFQEILRGKNWFCGFMNDLEARFCLLSKTVNQIVVKTPKLFRIYHM